MLGRPLDDLKFLPHAAQRLATPGQIERLADPLRNRHVAGVGCALNFAIFGILKDHLQSFRHNVSIIDSST